ncbi:sulfatase family protein [Brevifollis gellanilyticus]|uniref:Arylsulfatase n=1 Tax=Brevifollis gellanilyticus TaxID=748831 RepID=A0A512M6N7_9BACT|nr:arylsulfatase [Brevifollis gellanilyticus]GEP42400.1 arylsulfatase [Brevifollis gellanilyticus]
MKPIASTFLALLAFFGGQADAADSAKPNILLIFADDVGWGDAGCYGATLVKTPNIDRLAREGQRFVNGHASAAVCTPTRYSLITGQYSWRHQAEGLNKGVAKGDAPLLIPTTMTTAPGLLKQAGYRTALIGKWHLGFGLTKPDFNQELRPGPLETGFDEYFGLPATNDRIPVVFVRDHRVVGLDPADPIRYSYDAAEAKAQGMSPWAAGRNRIGWGTGGKAAWWKDTEIAETLVRESVQFIERSKEKPFFLLYAPHNVHAPAIPGPRFAGSSGLTPRADMLQELDACIGELLQTLDRLGLTKNTLILYSSDNGAYVIDEKGHKPGGPFRGKKSQLWEGGHRVPFVVRWPARIQPGVSADLVSTLDMPATICAAAGITLPKGSLPDSYNLLPAMLGEKDAPKRDHLILMSGNGDLAIRSGHLKYVPDLSLADGWYANKKKSATARNLPGLYDLAKDSGETQNLLPGRSAEGQHLADLLARDQASMVTRP